MGKAGTSVVWVEEEAGLWQDRSWGPDTMLGLIPEASPQRDGGPSLAGECGSKNTDNIVRVLTFCQNLLNASHACIHSLLLQKQTTTNLVASNTDFSSSGGQKSETGLTRTKSKVSVGLASF